MFGIDNAANAELYGMDVDTSFRVSDRWFFVGGVVWLRQARIRRVRQRLDWRHRWSGNELVRSPEWSATAAIEYEQTLRDLRGLTARIEYNYRSGFFYTPDNIRDVLRRTASGC